MITREPIVLTPPGAETIVTVDPLELTVSRLLLCANSGGGKSQALRLLIEGLANRIPVAIVDPEGEYASLRTHVNAVLVGGKREGDIVADPSTAMRLALRLLELNCSAILDLSDLTLDAKRLYLRLFIEGLLAAPRALWRPRLIVIDEAHRFAPESGKAESRQAVIDLMDSGRKRGFGGILATQRFSKLAKDAAAEANNLMVGRFAQDLDLTRASAILGFEGKSKWSTLQGLLPGEFMASGSAFNFDGVARFRTNHTTLTQHVRPGARHLVQVPASNKRVAELVAQLGDLGVPEPESEAAAVRIVVDTAAQERVAELEAELLAVRGENARLSEAISKAVDGLQRAQGWTRANGGQAVAVTPAEPRHVSPAIADPWIPDWMAEATTRPRIIAPPPTVTPIVQVSVGASRARNAAPDEKPVKTTPGDLGGAPSRVLTVLLQVGKPVTRTRAALLAGLSPKSGTFRNAMTTLRGATPPLLVDVSTGMLEASAEAKRKYAGTFTPLPTGAKLLEFWAGKLGGAHRRLFEVLAATSEPVTRETAAFRAGLSATSGTFRNAMTKLRGLGLMDDVADKQVVLGRELRK
jgi:hypothetical protein